MKKRVLSIALAVALIAIAVSGTLAYFADDDEVNNTFTLGSIEIEIYENGAATPDAEQPLGTLIPVVKNPPSADDNYKKKIVEVKNTGLSSAFIRVHIAIPSELVNYLQLEWDTTGWTRLESTEGSYKGVNYTVYSFDFNSAVESGKFTGKLLKGVYLGSDVDLKQDDDGNLIFVRKEGGKIIHESTFVAHTQNANGTYTSADVNILVAAQAIQTRGVADNATDALNTGFGTNTNPWQ